VGSPNSLRGNGVTSPYSANNNYNSANSSPAHQNFSPTPGYPPVAVHSSVSAAGTLTQICGLDGIPFLLREDLRYSKGMAPLGNSRRGSLIHVKSKYDLDHQYMYDFRTEQDALIS